MACSTTLLGGESIGFWIQTLIFFVSAVFAANQLKRLRLQEKSDDLKQKQRATIDAVLSERKDSELIRSRQVFAEMKHQKENFEALGAYPIIQNKVKNKAILDILNNYEFMSAGIRENAFDESIYKRMKCSLIIQDWKILELYILSLRKQTSRNSLFTEFEWLAKKWIDNPKLSS